MNQTDRKALELAIELTLAEPDAGRVEQVQSMLAERDRSEVGKFCAYHRQTLALNLKPYETAPCHALVERPIDHADPHRIKDARRLLDRMIEAGISQWHPDPLGALQG